MTASPTPVQATPAAARFRLRDGIILAGDAATAEWLGTTAEALPGRRLADLAPPLQADGRRSDMVLAERSGAAVGGFPQSFPWRVRTPAGAVLDGLLALSPDSAAPGTLDATLQSIPTAAHAGGRIADLPLRWMLDHTPVMIYLKDRDGRYLYANRQFLDAFGRSEAEILGRGDPELFPAAEAGQFRSHDLRVMQENRARQFEEEAPMAGGRRTFLSIKVPLCDAAGVPCAVWGISTDISDHKLTETLLLRAAQALSGASGETLLQDLVLAVADLLDADYAFIGVRSEENGETVIHTLAACAAGRPVENFHYPLTGSPCETVVGKQFRFYATRVRETFADPHVRELEVEGYAAFPLYDTHGAALGLFAVMSRRPLARPELAEVLLRIFSERAAAEIERQRAEEVHRNLESQLRQAQKMEAIGHLTGGIAHDFNNILTGLLGYLVMAREHAGRLGDATLGRYLDKASHSGDRARDLVQQLLTFSRGRRGEPRPVALAPLLRESLRLLESTLPASVELHLACEPDLPEVLLDPVHLEQILMNLCINARDAMEGQGRLALIAQRQRMASGHCASCRQDLEGEFVVLSVDDSGHGIPPEVRERMFEPFFTTKTVGKGSGMGLATVHGIVHEYGGHLRVISTPGSGTRMQVLLPPLAGTAATMETAVPDSGASTDPALLRGRVLLVDDDADVNGFMVDLLASWGLEVVTFHDAVEAARAFAGDPDGYQLAILDQTMPRMTGTELARHLHQLRPALPLILYTGQAGELPETTLAELGIRALLRKPVAVEQLRALLEKLAGR